MIRIALVLTLSLALGGAVTAPAAAAGGADAGQVAAPAGTGKVTSAKPAAVTLAEAFRSGTLALAVYVVPGTGDGRTLRIGIRNTGETPLRLVIPAGATALDVGDPIGTLHLRASARKTMTIAPHATARPVDLAQTGTRRAIDGKFRITFEDGKPSFRGEVTTGDVTP